MELTTPVVAKGTAVIGGGSLGAYGVTELVKSGGKEEVTQSQLSQVKNSSIPKAPVVIDDLSLKFLFSTTNFGTSGDYKSDSKNFGYALGRFLLDPDENNDKWMQLENQAKNTENSLLHIKFQEIKKGSDSDGKKIQEICRETYKKEKDELFKSENSLLLSNIWRYCSPFNLEPSNLGNLEAGDDLNKWGWSVSNQYYLLNVQHNDQVWNHVFKNVLKKDLESEEKKKNIDEKFININSSGELKNICQVAYKANPINTSDNYGENARNYCRLDLSVNLSNYPTKPN